MVLTTHTDPKIWGSDSYEFNPDRFANGITSACKLPHMYMPFGVGPRVCLGQKLAMVELKILLAFMVSNFSITLSPKYIHSPAMRLVIEPKHGVNRLVKKFSSKSKPIWQSFNLQESQIKKTITLYAINVQVDTHITDTGVTIPADEIVEIHVFFTSLIQNKLLSTLFISHIFMLSKFFIVALSLAK
ncbi:cytochrome P450 714A1-like [Camellia sinensis]|uniref:cytochrome P450 714A1-like n=1 Tax=Camellia sinensis TaxID=4442 RepID=UPI00103575F2|nr:cytochrome P450 714A1-like [Camellia sinensis]